MRALLFDKELNLSRDYPVPSPGKRESLIRVTHAGICNTDLEILKGYMGFHGIPGHEFVGIVEESSESTLIGKRVVGEINVTCGVCSFCRGHMQNHCKDRSVLGILNKNGAFAEYITLPDRNLHILADSVSDEEAVFVEPLAAAFQILKQVEIRPSSNVCVLGDGKLGILAARVISLKNCTPLLVGNHKEKLALLENNDIRTVLRSDFSENEFDVVIECTGSSEGVKTALDAVRPEGTIIVKTTVAGERAVDLNRLVVNEITMTGSRCGPFPEAIKAIEERRVETADLITGTFALDEFLEAFKLASDRGSLKVIFKIQNKPD